MIDREFYRIRGRVARTPGNSSCQGVPPRQPLNDSSLPRTAGAAYKQDRWDEKGGSQ